MTNSLRALEQATLEALKVGVVAAVAVVADIAVVGGC